MAGCNSAWECTMDSPTVEPWLFGLTTRGSPVARAPPLPRPAPSANWRSPPRRRGTGAWPRPCPSPWRWPGGRCRYRRNHRHPAAPAGCRLAGAAVQGEEEHVDPSQFAGAQQALLAAADDRQRVGVRRDLLDLARQQAALFLRAEQAAGGIHRQHLVAGAAQRLDHLRAAGDGDVRSSLLPPKRTATFNLSCPMFHLSFQCWRQKSTTQG